MISINSDDQNGLYQAVVQATGTKTKDPKKEALMLREKVKNEIQTNLQSYMPLLILQREYDLSNKTPRNTAVVQATGSMTAKSKKEALMLHEKVKNEVRAFGLFVPFCLIMVYEAITKQDKETWCQSTAESWIRTSVSVWIGGLLKISTRTVTLRSTQRFWKD
ncbi:hypothetical protein IRJ41_025214 [Triplophysa rosa]|uniref:Uncharacterized protein n=1 Tax=Triplophysa rosa TaxID=992332 RepID=A0A9W7WDB3_TRIRA|nr:hypothetical protein IRJ41_025214 [Triplophysa rosa]